MWPMVDPSCFIALLGQTREVEEHKLPLVDLIKKVAVAARRKLHPAQRHYNWAGGDPQAVRRTHRPAQCLKYMVRYRRDRKVLGLWRESNLKRSRWWGAGCGEWLACHLEPRQYLGLSYCQGPRLGLWPCCMVCGDVSSLWLLPKV